MNYGAIGFIIGHEITHGFDDMGRQYDADGNLRDWWQPKTADLFLKKAQCIIEQYGNYTDTSTMLQVKHFQFSSFNRKIFAYADWRYIPDQNSISIKF